MSAHAPDLAFQLVTLSKKIDQLLIKIEHGDEGYKDRSDNSDNNDIFHSIIFDKKIVEYQYLTENRPSLPDPRLVRRIIKLRIMRKKYFGFDLFADPAWDILLDLAAARSEFASVSVTSLCLASGVPSTTGLRWIKLLESAGLLRRKPDPTDGRRVFVELSDRGVKAMTSYFQSVGQLDKVIV